MRFEGLPDEKLCVWHAIFGALRHDLDSWEHLRTVSRVEFNVWFVICRVSSLVFGVEGFGFGVWC